MGCQGSKASAAATAPEANKTLLTGACGAQAKGAAAIKEPTAASVATTADDSAGHASSADKSIARLGEAACATFANAVKDGRLTAVVDKILEQKRMEATATAKPLEPAAVAEAPEQEPTPVAADASPDETEVALMKLEAEMEVVFAESETAKLQVRPAPVAEKASGGFFGLLRCCAADVATASLAERA